MIKMTNLKNRGVKVRNNLAFLKNTKATSLLIECCFVDDKDDVNAYNYKTMAKAIVEGILNKTINTDNLKNTKATSLLIECCFVDDKDDVNAYNYKTMAKAIVEGILNKTINTDNANNTKYTNCILYGNDIDKVSEEVLSWVKNDWIDKNVKDHIAWEGSNLFVVGGAAKNELEKMNTGENYASIVGNSRFDTVIQVLKNIGKL